MGSERSHPRSVQASALSRPAAIAETVADVLRLGGFHEEEDGLRQYLCLRLGDAAEGDAAFDELRAAASEIAPEELETAPGSRARLYRLARQIAERRRGARAAAGPGHRNTLPWRPVGSDAPPEWAAALARLRTELSPDDAELVELAETRGLGEAEIAYVLDVGTAELEALLAGARARAAALAGGPSTLAFGRQLGEAFVLAGRSTLAPDSAQVEPLPPGMVVGERYRIDECLGSGAFADVYRAEDTEVPGHLVALKMMRQPSRSETARAAALRELHLIASVFHPSVVHFKAHGWHEDRLWYVMPRYDGETLEARMERGPLARAEARRIFEPLARALAAVHAAGVRHQDIKPGNIFLARVRGFGEDGFLPVLIDLGVAAREAEAVLGGTPMYLAPEVAAQFASLAAPRAVTPRADVFSLALALRNALEPGTQEEVNPADVRGFVARRARSVPVLPRSRDLRYLKPHLRRWLAVDPEARPAAEQLADELAVLTRPEDRRRRRNAILRRVIPILCAVAAVFVGVVWLLTRRAEMEQHRAEQARGEAAHAKASLVVEDARRRALEAGNEDLRQKYESSRLTRSQLARELAVTGEQVRLLQEGLAVVERARTDLAAELEGARGEGKRLADELASTQAQLGVERTRAGELAAALESARSQASGLETDLEKARTRAKDLAGEAEVLRAGLAREKEHARDLETRLAAAESARVKAEAERSELARSAEPEPAAPRHSVQRVHETGARATATDAAVAPAAKGAASPPAAPRVEDGGGGTPP